MSTALIRVCSAIALLVGSAYASQPSRTQTAFSGLDGFPVAAAEVHQVVASGEAIAIVSTSSMGGRVLSIRNLRTGEEVLKRDRIGAAAITFRGTYVAFLDATSQATVIDISSGRESLVWSPSDGSPVTAMCMGTDRLFLLTRGPDEEYRLASLPVSDTTGTRSDHQTASLQLGREPVLLCSPSTAVVSIPEQDRAIRSADGELQLVPLEGRRLVAATDGFLYGVGPPSTISRRPTTGGGEWQVIYQGAAGGRIEGVVSVGELDKVTNLVELKATGSAELVTLTTEAQAPTRSPLAADRAWDQPHLWTVTEDSIAALGRRDGTGWVFVARVPSPSEIASGSTHDASAVDSKGDRERGAAALLWMERQLGPRFQTRLGRVGRLIDSYADDKRVGWIYDASIAAIAFTARGRADLAGELLGGLAHLQNEDGSWEFAYDPDRALPIKGERYLGSIAWVVIAANFFEWETHDRTFDATATAALDFIDRFVVRDATSPLNGAVSMGPVAPQTYSTEHNVDSYSAFFWRGRLANRSDYLQTASNLEDFVVRELLSRTDKDEVYFKVGARDATLYLDPQTWTALALVTRKGAGTFLSDGLELVQRRLQVTAGRVGESTNISGFRDAETAATDKVWSEGTEGMVAARLALGQLESARFYHREMFKMQTPAGGVVYASENQEGWPGAASVAGTAWFVLNHEWPPRNPFVPDNTSWLESHRDLAHSFPLGANSGR